MIYDALVVGGSFAGLSTALYVARAGRNVVVLDSGQPRNRFSPHSHGVLAQDGAPGAVLLSAARAQLARYPSATFVKTTVTTVERDRGNFTARTEDGRSFTARRLVLATGFVDQLPEIAGLKERWGKSVLHCPYCHGFELTGNQIGVIATSAASPHQAILLTDWGEVTFFVNGIAQLDDFTRATFAKRRIKIIEMKVLRLEGAGESVERVVLADGRVIKADAVFVAAPLKPGARFAEQLGCRFDEGVAFPYLRTDQSKMTNVPGVYAVGDHAREMHNINLAVADGTTAGIALHQSLMLEETIRIAEVAAPLPTTPGQT